MQALYTTKLGEGQAPATVARIHAVLRRAFGEAARICIVQCNVVALVKPPRPARHEMHVLTTEQARVFLAAVVDDSLEALYVLAITTGMRLGELLALRWQDIDLDRAKLQVRMNVQEAEKGFILAEPKTTYSRRSIGLTRAAVQALRAHGERQNEERLALGAAWDASLNLVFPNIQGGLMLPRNLVGRSFKGILKELGLSEEIRFHDLRHTAATLLLSWGVHPKVVSEMLGHADIAITLRVYAHVMPHMQEAAIHAMDTLFGDPLGEPQG